MSISNFAMTSGLSLLRGSQQTFGASGASGAQGASGASGADNASGASSASGATSAESIKAQLNNLIKGKASGLPQKAYDMYKGKCNEKGVAVANSQTYTVSCSAQINNYNCVFAEYTYDPKNPNGGTISYSYHIDTNMI